MAEHRDDLVIRYFNEGLSYSDILFVLRESHSISLSLRHLHRLLRSLNLRRRNYSNIGPVIDFVLNEIDNSGRLQGYRMMRQRCLANGLRVRTQDVASILQVCDPAGVARRTSRRFIRRSYFAPGPNFLWHIDGYDKLKPFGLCIHGCICGFSRKVMWLNVYKTNNNPRVIAGYFLETVEKYGGTAYVIRADFGTENVIVREIQRRFRMNNDARTAYIEGASTQNQRIECWWGRHLRRQHMQHWIDIFKGMQEGFEFSGSDLDKNLVQFCFMALIQMELDLAMSLWNCHTIRRSRNSNMPSGQPNRIYDFPQLWNSRSYMWPVCRAEIAACQNDVEFRSTVCCDPDIYDMCISIMADNNFMPPENANEGIELYRQLRMQLRMRLA